MNIETLLSHFDGVKETGHGRFVARCSAHDDRSPSLAISEGDGGRLLLHCWAGCETEDILAARGLTFADVMPKRVGQEHAYKPRKDVYSQIGIERAMRKPAPQIQNPPMSGFLFAWETPPCGAALSIRTPTILLIS